MPPFGNAGQIAKEDGDDQDAESPTVAADQASRDSPFLGAGGPFRAEAVCAAAVPAADQAGELPALQVGAQWNVGRGAGDGNHGHLVKRLDLLQPVPDILVVGGDYQVEDGVGCLQAGEGKAVLEVDPAWVERQRSGGGDAQQWQGGGPAG